MAVNRKKRLRKIEQKKAKRKAKRQVTLSRASEGFVERLERAAGAPIVHCVLGGDIEGQGMGSILISRRLSPGEIAFAMFLVDCYCLGVKDSFARIKSPASYADRFDDWLAREGEELDPPAARKLIEGAVEYARGLGFSPRGNYHKARAIFGDIDPAACSEEFEYGKDGKPTFINGPHDTPKECERIWKTLELHCGRGNFESIYRIL